MKWILLAIVVYEGSRLTSWEIKTGDFSIKHFLQHEVAEIRSIFKE